jgi:hypothetical protein
MTSKDRLTMRTLTEPEQQLLDYLAMIREFKRKSPLPKGFHYHGPEDFVLQHGQWFDLRPLPRSVPRGAAKHCFHNAAALGMNRGLRYFEGYAVIYFPVPHAWNADAQGQLIDTTWKNEGKAYFGVEFEVGKAYQSIWKMEAPMLEDYKGKFQLFRKPWPGVPKEKESDEIQIGN